MDLYHFHTHRGAIRDCRRSPSSWPIGAGRRSYCMIHYCSTIPLRRPTWSPVQSIDPFQPIYPSIYDGEKISVRCILHFSCKTCSAQLERGHYSCLQCLSRECRKCALRHSSSPEEAKHCMRSDFTTRYIGAYYKSCLSEHPQAH